MFSRREILPVLTTGPGSPKSWALGLFPKLDPGLASVSWRLSESPLGPSFYMAVSSPSLRSFLSRKEAFPGPCPHCSPPGALLPSDLAMPGWCHLVLLCRVWRLMAHRDKLKARALAHCYFSITARDLKGKQDFCRMCPRVPEYPHYPRAGSVHVETIATVDQVMLRCVGNCWHPQPPHSSPSSAGCHNQKHL